MYASAEEFANLNGVLVKRQYKPGQQYIQLVFKTAEGFQLSLTRNLQMVRRLKIGRSYNIIGPQYIIGEKSYIQEPTATLVENTARSTPVNRFNKRLIWIIVAILFVIILGGVSMLALSSSSLAKNNGTNAKIVNPVNKQPPLATSASSTSQINETHQSSTTSGTSDHSTNALAAPAAATRAQSTINSNIASDQLSAESSVSQNPTPSTPVPQTSDNTTPASSTVTNSAVTPTDSGNSTSPACDPTTDPSCTYGPANTNSTTPPVDTSTVLPSN